MRVEGTDEQPVLVGYAAVFNQDSQPLPFIERIRPGAFKRSLESGQDILALVDHDRGKIIARRSNGTLKLEEDEHGLRVEIAPNMETSYGRDIVALVKRRDVAHMSIGFYARRDEWQGDRREIIEADLREVSIVAAPAYTGTSISKREQGGETDMKLEVRELRQKLAALKDEEREILAKEEPTDEERARLFELAKEIRSLEDRIAEAEKATAKPAAPAVLMTPSTDEQREAFAAYLRGQPFDTRAMTVGTGSSGGYLAPEGFRAEVIRRLNEESVMRQVARVITISTHSVMIPRLTDELSAAWTAEGAPISESQPSFDQVEFTPFKLAALTLVSNELLNDSGVDVESLLAQLFAEKIAAVEDQAFLAGTGAGQPSGLLNEAAIERVTTASAGAIDADDILALYDALPPQYRGNAAWIMHPNTMSQLRRLQDNNGQYLLVSGLAGAAPTTLLGRPVYLSSNMPAPASGADVIVFGDIRRAYYIVDRQELEVQRSTDRYFEQDLTAFRAIKRTDGKVVLPDAVRVLQMAAS